MGMVNVESLKLAAEWLISLLKELVRVSMVLIIVKIITAW